MSDNNPNNTSRNRPSDNAHSSSHSSVNSSSHPNAHSSSRTNAHSCANNSSLPNPTPKIRLWQFEDLKGIMRLEEIAFTDSWSEAAIYYALDSIEPVQAFALVVPHEDEIIAYALFQGVFETWEVFRIAVHPEWRRRGLARDLLLEGIKIAQRSDGEKLYLEVRENNVAARKLYESLGFRPFSKRDNYYADGANAVLYRLFFDDLENISK